MRVWKKENTYFLSSFETSSYDKTSYRILKQGPESSCPMAIPMLIALQVQEAKLHMDNVNTILQLFSVGMETETNVGVGDSKAI